MPDCDDRLQSDRADDDDPAEKRGIARHLGNPQPHPQRAQYQFKIRQQTELAGTHITSPKVNSMNPKDTETTPSTNETTASCSEIALPPSMASATPPPTQAAEAEQWHHVDLTSGAQGKNQYRVANDTDARE